MGKTFKQRLETYSDSKKSNLILAADFKNIESSDYFGEYKKIVKTINDLGEYIAGLKINFHLLLPLDKSKISDICKLCKQNDIIAIADMKLNDISSTNMAVGSHLWTMGFDGVIVNPITGYNDGLDKLISMSHRKNKGIISLVHMSHKGANEFYSLKITKNKKSNKLYELFLKNSVRWNVDGIVVGASKPTLVKSCSEYIQNIRNSNKRPLIFSPGVGFQGGNALKTMKLGTNYIIVGRSILNSRSPVSAAKKFSSLSWND
jgi:orotidine-5'-phosphate decarboxylase